MSHFEALPPQLNCSGTVFRLCQVRDSPDGVQQDTYHQDRLTPLPSKNNTDAIVFPKPEPRGTVNSCPTPQIHGISYDSQNDRFSALSLDDQRLRDGLSDTELNTFADDRRALPYRMASRVPKSPVTTERMRQSAPAIFDRPSNALDYSVKMRPHTFDRLVFNKNARQSASSAVGGHLNDSGQSHPYLASEAEDLKQIASHGFSLDWQRIGPIQFTRTEHLKNPWNGHKKIKVARDGTEVEPTVGELLIREWDRNPAQGPIRPPERPI